MQKNNLNWQTTDAQLIEAILLATGGEGGAPLQEVLLMADAVDGSVYTLKELEEALERLTAAGLVQMQKNKLALTPLFLETSESMNEGELTGEAILDQLKTYAVAEQNIDEARIALKKCKLKSYYQQYLEQYG